MIFLESKYPQHPDLKKLRGCLVCVFKQQFSVFKQHFTYFNTLFHPHVFPQIFLNNNFQFLNTHTKRALSIAKKFAIVLQYGVILKVNLHRSSIVKKNTNILFKLYQFLSLSPVTLSSLFFLLLFFYYFHSLIQSLPLSCPSLPFHFFFLSIFP